jgi:choline dehydrogenase-like flavoprotein
MLQHLGMHPDHLLPRNAYLKTEIPIAGATHQAGTCRFGTDPASSVLDTNCKAHELDNLYVVDTGFFVSIGAVNPSLSAMAQILVATRRNFLKLRHTPLHHACQGLQ